MKVAIVMNKDSYVGREYAQALISAGLEFYLLAIGSQTHKGNAIEDERCAGLWQVPTIAELSASPLLQYYEFASLHDESFLDFLDQQKFALGIQGGTGILKANVFQKFSIAMLNFHPGDLPAYRGCSAPEWQLSDNKPVISTCHVIDTGIDTGAIYQKKVLNLDLSTYHAMRASVYPQTAKFMAEVVAEVISKGDISADLLVQDESLANYRPYIGAELIEVLASNLKNKFNDHYVS